MDKTKAKQIAVRAIKTWFQAFLAVFAIEAMGSGFDDVLTYLGGCALKATVASILSICTSVVGGIPESQLTDALNEAELSNNGCDSGPEDIGDE